MVEKPPTGDLTHFDQRHAAIPAGQAIETRSSPLRDRAADVLRAEARDVFGAAGVRVADLVGESTQDLSGFVSRSIPGHEREGGSTWQSLVRGVTVESEFLNGEIVLLARLHGREAPANAAVVGRIARAVAERTPARSLSDEDLLVTLPELAPV